MATNPPRQREGKPFPGGKRLRKALERLQCRKNADTGRYTRKPGSMK